MLRFTKDSFVDTDKYEEYLNYRNYIYFDRARANLIMQYQRSKMYTTANQATRILRAESAGTLLDLSKNNILEYLIDIKGCPEKKFRQKGVQGYSLDQKKVLIPLMQRLDVREFLSTYMAHKSMKSITGKMKSLLYEVRPSDKKNAYEDNLYELGFEVGQQTNLRYNYKNTDIVTIPRDYDDCITVPDGYVMVWGDFEQSDLRIAYNLFIRDERNAKIMDSCKDKYEGMARIVADAFNEKFDPDKFKEERKLYKVYVLATIYGRRTGDTKEANAFIRKFSKYLETCPRYMEYYNRLVARYKLGLSMFVNGYFGHKESVAIDSYRMENTINFALNSPIQTGTSQVVILTVNSILEKFYERGYTKEDICLYYTRHDEPVFIMKEDILNDAWIFNECSEILVDNWTPLRLSFSLGYRYNNEDTKLMESLKEVYKLNEDKITKYEMDTSTVYDYMPIAKTLVISFNYVKLSNGQSVVAFYHPDSNRVDYMLASTTKDEELETLIEEKFSAITQTLYDNEYRGVIVESNVLNKTAFYNNLYFKYEKNMGVDWQKAEILSYYVANRYALKNNIELEIPEGVEVNFNTFAKTVKELNLIK